MISDACRIRVIRALLGMDSKSFAQRLNISAGTLTGWEHGRCEPQRENRKTLSALCQENKIAFLPSGYPILQEDLMTTQENQ